MKHKYSLILGSMGNTRDRFCPGYKDTPPTMEMLRRALGIPDVTGIELVGTWDIRPDNIKEMKSALGDAGWQCVSIIPDLFTQPIYGKGALSSPDSKVRRHAIDNTKAMCDAALELSCGLINLWPGQDGFDYLLATDYEQERENECSSIRELATAYPELRFALEYKPKEPRTHSYLARMGDTLLLAQETGCQNVGVTIDTGHAFYAGEVVADQVIVAKRAGNRLFHMHFNDNYAAWDDDMIVGSVHTVEYLEILYWLDRTGYDGWLSMDQYPYREEAAGAIGESIQWLKQFGAIIEASRSEIDRLITQRDGIATSRFLRTVLLQRMGK
ncbi:MAG: sugar phosphate isomerase/epimerase [Verrucomicrobiota bacterium]|nr:sugar phosphate isomerase/epimerase [Verrucomicrobiota bacterium]